MSTRVSVVVVASGRNGPLRTCLTHLLSARSDDTEVLVVVNTAADQHTEPLVQGEFQDVLLVRTAPAHSSVAGARRAGLAASHGDVVAFVADDVVVSPDWLDEITSSFSEPDVVAVGGRTIRGREGEESRGLGQIGRLLPDGRMTRNFAADPGRVVVVDHLDCSNVAFRRTALEAVGGFRDGYPGALHFEDTDVTLRVGADRGRLLYAPCAVATRPELPRRAGTANPGAAALYAERRNHLVLLVRLFGWTDPVIRYWTRTVLRDQQDHLRSAMRQAGRRSSTGKPRALRRRLGAPLVLARSVAELFGLVAGALAAGYVVHGDRTGRAVTR